jgi:energy-converting hydrogenase Eha subunit B
MEFDYKKLIENKIFQRGVVLSVNSIHGLSHWRKP